MSRDDLGKLFTAFFRSENKETRLQPGTGLGLVITKGIIEAHGGAISVESTLGVGTTVRFWIPAMDESLTEAASEGWRAQPAA